MISVGEFLFNVEGKWHGQEGFAAVAVRRVGVAPHTEDNEPYICQVYSVTPPAVWRLARLEGTPPVWPGSGVDWNMGG